MHVSMLTSTGCFRPGFVKLKTTKPYAHMSAFIKSSTDAEVNRQPFAKISGAIFTMYLWLC